MRAKIAAVTLPESVPAGVVDLVCWRVEWAAALASAVEASLPELAPPGSTGTTRSSPAPARSSGSTGLMTRMGPGVLEIGYWLHTGHAGRGYATAAARALADLGLAQPGIGSVLIRHDAANVASGRGAEKAGFLRIADIPSTIDVPDGPGIEVRWERRG